MSDFYKSLIISKLNLTLVGSGKKTTTQQIDNENEY
jgi:hypothetical protein